MAIKTLEERLARIHANPHGGNDYILADAKDADMALSIGAPGRSPERWPDGEMKHKTLSEFREQITEIVHQGLVDIMLMSASTAEVLCMEAANIRTTYAITTPLPHSEEEALRSPPAARNNLCHLAASPAVPIAYLANLASAAAAAQGAHCALPPCEPM